MIRIDPKEPVSDIIWDTAETLVHRATLMENKAESERLLRAPSQHKSLHRLKSMEGGLRNNNPTQSYEYPVLVDDKMCTTLQRKPHKRLPFLGIARPQSQFSHSCVCERFINSQDRSTYFVQQNFRYFFFAVYKYRVGYLQEVKQEWKRILLGNCLG